MHKVIFLTYIVSAIYAIYIFASICLYLFKKVPFKEILSIFSQKKYACFVLAVAMIICSVHFYFSCTEIIPEKAYPINTILNISDDTTEYRVATEVYYYKDIDRQAKKQDPEYLKKDSSFTNTFVNRTFWLSSFNYDYYIEDIPETVVSGYKYDVMILLPEDREGDDSEFYRASATIEIPILTSKTLGITVLDQLRNMNLMTYVHHIAIFILELLGLVICILGKKRKKS